MLQHTATLMARRASDIYGGAFDEDECEDLRGTSAAIAHSSPDQIAALRENAWMRVVLRALWPRLMRYVGEMVAAYVVEANVKRVVRETFRTLPMPWLSRDLTEWVNASFLHVWPMLQSAVQDMIEAQVTPEIVAALPAALAGKWVVSIEANLGRRPFEVESVRTLPMRIDPETGRKDLDVCFDLCLDQRQQASEVAVGKQNDAPLLRIVVGPASAFVRDFVFKGRLFLTLNDVSADRHGPDSLFCAGISWYFTTPPEIDFELDVGGLARLAPNIHTVKPSIVAAIQSAIAKRMLLPKRMTHIFCSDTKASAGAAAGDKNPPGDAEQSKIKNENKDEVARQRGGNATGFRNLPERARAEMTYPMPKGKLTIRVLRAENLRGDDWNLCTPFTGERTSDPYVRVAIGADEYYTPTIYRNCDPDWMAFPAGGRQPRGQTGRQATQVRGGVPDSPQKYQQHQLHQHPAPKKRARKDGEPTKEPKAFPFLIESVERQTCEISVWDEDEFSGDDLLAKTSLRVLDLVKACYASKNLQRGHHNQNQHDSDHIRGAGVVKEYVSQTWFPLTTVSADAKTGREVFSEGKSRLLLRCEWQSVDRATAEREEGYMMRFFPSVFSGPADRFVVRVGLDCVQNVYDFTGVKVRVRREKSARASSAVELASAAARRTTVKAKEDREDEDGKNTRVFTTPVHQVLPPISNPGLLAEAKRDIATLKKKGVPAVLISEILAVDVDLVDDRVYGKCQLDEVFCFSLRDPREETLRVDVIGVRDEAAGADGASPGPAAEELVGTFQYALGRLLRERSNVQKIECEVAPRQVLHGSLEIVMFTEEGGDEEGDMPQQTDCATRQKRPAFRKSRTEEYFLNGEADVEEDTASASHDEELPVLKSRVHGSRDPDMGGEDAGAPNPKQRWKQAVKLVSTAQSATQKLVPDESGYREDFLDKLIRTLWPYAIEYVVKEIGNLAPNSAQAVRTVLDGLPSPTPFGLTWLNLLLHNLWSVVQAVIEDVIQTDVLPSIRANLPAALRDRMGLKLVCDLGNNPPKLKYIRSRVKRKHSETETSCGAASESVELFLNLDGDFSEGSRISLTIGGVSVGVENLKVRGLFVVSLCDLIDSPPFVQGISAYFVNPPECEFRFAGGLDFLHQVNLYPIIESSISGAVGRLCVLPQRIAVPLVDTATKPDDDEADEDGADVSPSSASTVSAGSSNTAFSTPTTAASTKAGAAGASGTTISPSSSSIARSALKPCKEQGEVLSNVGSSEGQHNHNYNMPQEQRLRFADLLAPMPQGILEIEVVSASNLRGDDWNFPRSLWSGVRTSDPYVQVVIGGCVTRTRTLNANNERPTWHTENKFTFLIEDAAVQTLSLQVFDDDMFSGDDKIGERSILVRDLLRLAASGNGDGDDEHVERSANNAKQSVSGSGCSRIFEGGEVVHLEPGLLSQSTETGSRLDLCRPFEHSKRLLDGYLQDEGAGALASSSSHRDQHISPASCVGLFRDTAPGQDEAISVLALHRPEGAFLRPHPKLFVPIAAQKAATTYREKDEPCSSSDNEEQGQDGDDADYFEDASVIENEPRLLLTRLVFGPTSSYSAIGLQKVWQEYYDSGFALLYACLELVLGFFFFSTCGGQWKAENKALEVLTRKDKWMRLLPVAHDNSLGEGAGVGTDAKKQAAVARQAVNRKCSAVCDLALTTICPDGKGNEVPEVKLIGDRILHLMRKNATGLMDRWREANAEKKQKGRLGGSRAGRGRCRAFCAFLASRLNTPGTRTIGRAISCAASIFSLSSVREFAEKAAALLYRGVRFGMLLIAAAVFTQAYLAYPMLTIAAAVGCVAVYMVLFDVGEFFDALLDAMRCRSDPDMRIDSLHDARIRLRVRFRPVTSEVACITKLDGKGRKLALAAPVSQVIEQQRKLAGERHQRVRYFLQQPEPLDDERREELAGPPKQETAPEEAAAILRVSIEAVKSLLGVNRCKVRVRLIKNYHAEDGCSSSSSSSSCDEQEEVKSKRANKNHTEQLKGNENVQESQIVPTRSPLLDNDFLNATLTHDTPSGDSQALADREKRLRHKIQLLTAVAEARSGKRASRASARGASTVGVDESARLDLATVADACNVSEDVARVYAKQVVLPPGGSRKTSTDKSEQDDETAIGNAVLNECFMFKLWGDGQLANAAVQIEVLAISESKPKDGKTTGKDAAKEKDKKEIESLVGTWRYSVAELLEDAREKKLKNGSACSSIACVFPVAFTARSSLISRLPLGAALGGVASSEEETGAAPDEVLNEAAALRREVLSGDKIKPRLTAHFQLAVSA